MCERKVSHYNELHEDRISNRHVWPKTRFEFSHLQNSFPLGPCFPQQNDHMIIVVYLNNLVYLFPSEFVPVEHTEKLTNLKSLPYQSNLM